MPRMPGAEDDSPPPFSGNRQEALAVLNATIEGATKEDIEEGVVTRDDLVEGLSDAIQDSIDMDWNSNDGAIAVADYFEKERMSVIRRGGRDLQAFEDGWNYAIDFAEETSDKYYGAVGVQALAEAWAEYSTEQKPCENRFALLQRVNELNVKAGAHGTGEVYWTVTVLYNTVIYKRQADGKTFVHEVIEGVPQ